MELKFCTVITYIKVNNCAKFGHVTSYHTVMYNVNSVCSSDYTSCRLHYGTKLQAKLIMKYWLIIIIFFFPIFQTVSEAKMILCVQKNLDTINTPVIVQNIMSAFLVDPF